MSWKTYPVTGKPLTKEDLDEAIKAIENDRGSYGQPGIHINTVPIPYREIIPTFDPKEDLTGSFVSVPKGEFINLLTRVHTLEGDMARLVPMAQTHQTAISNQATDLIEALRQIEDILSHLQEVNDKLDEYLIETIETRYP